MARPMQPLLKHWEICKLPSLYLLGGTITFLTVSYLPCKIFLNLKAP